MTTSSGPKLGQFISGAPGDPHFAIFLKFLRSYEAYVQPTVKSRVAAVPTSGMVNGDLYLLTAAPNANSIARYYSDTNVSPSTGWEYFTAFDGMYVWSTADQKGYRFKGTPTPAWAEETTGGGGGSGGTTQTVAISSNTLNLSAVTADTVLTTLNQNITSVVLPAGASGVRKDIMIRFVQDATAGRTVTGWSGVTWEGGVAPPIQTAASAVTVIVLTNMDNGGWYGFVDSGLTLDSGGRLMLGQTDVTGMANGSANKPGMYLTSGTGAQVNQCSSDAALYNSKATGYTSNNFQLYFVAGTQVGSISTTGTATAFNTSSDGNLKMDIEAIPNGVEIFDAIEWVRFHWKAAPDSDWSYGVVAQQLKGVFPDAVTGEDGETDAAGNRLYMGVDYSKLVPILAAKIKAQDERMAALEALVKGSSPA